MAKHANYFISGNRAYRSELELFRQERVTAARCAIVKAPGGAAELFLVEGARGSLTASADLAKAFGLMVRQNGRRMISVHVW